SATPGNTGRATDPASLETETDPPDKSALETPEPADEPTATPDPDQPEPAEIEFSKKDGSQSETFKQGGKVWWNATLPGVERRDMVTINVYNATGDLLHSWTEQVGR